MKPNKLKSNDCIGIFSPSSATNQKALDNMKYYFESRGFKIKIAPNTLKRNGYMAGTPEERASDLNSLINDEEVKLIITANGGESSIQILSLIDYLAFSKNPKLIVGLSDPTCLLNALTSKTEVITIHGANGYNFGHKTPTPFTEQNWWQILTGDFKIPFKYPVQSQIKVEKGGKSVSGLLIGGNLRNIVYLIGTDFSPNFDNAILFIEEIGMQIHEIDAIINQLKLANVFKKISGLIIGQFVGCEESEENAIESVEQMIMRNIKEYDFPVISNIPLGHTADKITLVIGSKIKLDMDIPSIEIIENPYE